ncbi:Oligosaccharide translocation protein RFT1 [Candida tropicalis]
MTFVTVAILILSYLFVDRLGLRTSGLILANMINMSLRIIYCYRQIQRYYIQYGISIKMRNILGYVAPSVAVALSAWIAQYVAIGGRTGSFIQLIFSAGMSTLVLMILIFLERDNVKQPLSSVTRRFIKNKSD